MLVNVGFSIYGTAWKAVTDEQYAKLRQHVAQLPADKNSAWGDYLTDDEGLVYIASLKLDVTLAPADPKMNTMLVKLQDRISALELKGHSKAEMAAAGAIVQIHVPDTPLLYIDDVMHVDDCCTNELGGYLKEGWRILAVCPPNAQRRPDYILGRRNMSGGMRELTTGDLYNVERELVALKSLMQLESSRGPGAAVANSHETSEASPTAPNDEIPF